ncbi:unnamed protein product, partial [Meganyctiphanes norvegica]
VTYDAKHDSVSRDEDRVKSQTPLKKELDNKKIVQENTSIDLKLKQFGSNRPVVQVIEELEKLIEPIFKAIENMNLFGINSADSLLKDCGLPGTIRDSQGNSILHYLIFPIQQDKLTPGVTADDIKRFLCDHNAFVNAANYKGQTALHALVIKASKAYSIEEWKSMAQLLLAVGCDPGISDNNDELPEDVALYRGCDYLQDLLKE